VDAALAGHFLGEEGVDHPVPGGLALGLELVRDDDESEVSLPGGAALHGLVVGVQMRVIVDLKGSRLESGGDLCADDLFYRRAGTHGGNLAAYG
jgi:hypothetical protein